MPLKEGLLRSLSFPSRFQVYGLKVTLWSGLECAPCSDGTKAGSHPHQPKTVLHSLQGPGQNSKNLNRHLKYGIIWPCQSSWNTPLLPIQKPETEDFRPVQDLQAVNSATVTLHFIVSNPYTLLGLVPNEAKFFTHLDLKVAFFSASAWPRKPAYFCLPVGKSQYWRKGATNLDSIASDLKTPSLPSELLWHPTSKLSQPNSTAAHSSST
jgi:hypothetical protein